MNWIHVDVSDTVKWREEEREEEQALGERKGEDRKTQEQSETEGERVGGEIKRNKSEKGVEPARDRDGRRGRGKREREHV